MHLLSIKFIIIYVFICCSLMVHWRGKVKLRLTRHMLDQSTLMAPINCLMYFFSAVPNRPFLSIEQFPELLPLGENWELIRTEALKLFDQGLIKASNRHDDAGFNTFFKRGWKRFYLKWYDTAHPSARELCPHTVALLEQIPTIKAGMFALLPPGGRLGAHRDPYAGSLRYHLGLSTPNSKECALIVDGETYSWHDGEAVVFDETYVHEAYNYTDAMRIILFCDIARPMRTIIGRGLTRFCNNTLMKAASAPNTEHDRTGFINRTFKYIYHIQAAGQRLKEKNRRLYYFSKYSLLLVLGLLIIFA